MLETKDIVYICNHGLMVKVDRDKDDITRLTIDLFDFSILDDIEDALEKFWVVEAVSDFIVRFATDMDFGEILTTYLLKPIDDSLLLLLEDIIQTKIYKYEDMNGMSFEKLLAIHIANYLYGRALELETGHVH
ncbi:hypothetical protein MG295_00057 [Bacillus phage vB_BcgM]|nr:hypothetical protein MG295_00057 [Bacillus phage vB_BcgM]